MSSPRDQYTRPNAAAVLPSNFSFSETRSVVMIAPSWAGHDEETMRSIYDNQKQVNRGQRRVADAIRRLWRRRLTN